MPADVEPEDLLRPRRRLVGIRRELDPAGLAAPAGQHLGLDDDRPAELLRRLPRLLGGERERARRDRDPEPREQLLALVLVQVHAGADLIRAGDRGRRRRILRAVPIADQLTLARIACAPLVVVLFTRRLRPATTTGGPRSSASRCRPTGSTGGSRAASGRTTSFGSLLDPVADKVLVLATLVVLLDQGVFPAWMVAAIVARELLSAACGSRRSSAAS